MWRGVENLLIRTIAIVIFFLLFYQKTFSLFFFKVHLYNIHTGVKFERQDAKAFFAVSFHEHLLSSIFLSSFVYRYVLFFSWFGVNFQMKSFGASFTVSNLKTFKSQHAKEELIEESRVISTDEKCRSYSFSITSVIVLI